VTDTTQVDLEAVIAAAGSVQDPEIRRTLTEMDLMDGAEVDAKGRVKVHYHLTSPLCPSAFAIQIGQEVRRRVMGVPGVTEAQVVIQDHFIAAEIARKVNEGEVVGA
jgi:metal-sulfur cluster biosynthetic enzyme